MNPILFLIPLLLVITVPTAFAQVVETKGQNYDLVENFFIGEANWQSHPERIMDGGWQNYALSNTGDKVIFNTNAVGSFIFDKNSCSYSIYGNGFDGEQIIPSVSAVATYLNNGQWQNLPVNDEACTVTVDRYEDGVFLKSTKVITEDITEDVFIPYTGTTENFYGNGTNSGFTLESNTIQGYLDGVNFIEYTGSSELFYANSTNSGFTLFDNVINTGYFNGETRVIESVPVESFVQEIRLDINSGFKETFKVIHDGSEELGISQTIHSGESITIGETVIDIVELNGQSFDRQFIIDNQAEILAITDSVNYDFDTGIDSLSNVNIIFDGDYKVNLDYADGGFVNYLEIDPTFTTTAGTYGRVFTTNTSSGTSCSTTYLQTDTSTYIQRTHSGTNQGCQSVYYSFDITSITDTSIITSAELEYDVVYAGNSPPSITWRELSTSPPDGQTTVNDSYTGTVITASDSGGGTTGTGKTIALNSNGVSGIQNKLSSNTYSLTGYFDNNVRDGTERTIAFDSATTKLNVIYVIPTTPQAPTGLTTVTGIPLELDWDSPLVTTNYKVHSFTTVGTDTFQVTAGSGDVEYLVIGGGGGGSNGGGGSGAYRTATGFGVTAQSYSITVGDGGSGSAGALASNGGDSIFDSITSNGGAGGEGNGVNGVANTGNGSGSGSGGSSSLTLSGGSGGTYGYSGGGNSGYISPPYPAGGGGGSSEAGQSAPSSSVFGKGGDGTSSSITGTAIIRAGGGSNGVGGTGGGGSNGDVNGDINTGSGGAYNGSGGSGIVIVRYLDDGSITATGGTVTTIAESNGGDGGSPITGYKVFRTLNEFALSELPDSSGSDSQLTFTDNEFLIHGFPVTDSSTNSITINAPTGVSYEDVVWDSATASGGTISGNTFTDSGGGSWGDGIARSTQTISPSTGGGEMTCTKSYTYAMCGFSKDPFWTSGNTFANGDYLIYHDEVYELGSAPSGSQFTGASASTVFKVTMDSNGLVKYYADNVEVHQSTVTASGTYYALAVPDTNDFVTAQIGLPKTIGSSTTGVIDTGIQSPDISFTDSNLPDNTDDFSIGSWVKLDESRDSTKDGTNNGATTGQTGKINNAWQFDGSNDNVSLPLGTAFDGLSGATISGWVNWDSSGGTYQCIFGVGDSDSERMEVCIEQGGNLYYYAGNGNVSYSYVGISNLPSGAWHYVTIVYDGTLTNSQRIQVYIDGTLMTGQSTTSTHGTTLGTFTNDGSIGKRPHGTHYYKGLQDEVVFYNKALTSTEVSALYNGGSGDSTPDTNGLVAHYNFEQTGTTLENQIIIPPTNFKLLGLNDVTFNVGTDSASVDAIVATVIPPQGYDGGVSAGSGGGGGGGVGGDGTTVGTPTANTGTGGIGITSTITGSSVDYAGGGGGKYNYNGLTFAGTASHGGGAGSHGSGGDGVDGKGGGGGGSGFNINGGAGGDGVLILRFDSSNSYSTTGSPTVDTSSVSGKTILTYSAGSGGFTLNSDFDVEYLLIAGGGGGGRDGFNTRWSGGGGAGGVLQGTVSMTSGTYPITVGTGGAGGNGNSYTAVVGGDGTDSTFNGMTSVGGGGGIGHGSGAPYVSSARDGGSGGSLEGLGVGSVTTYGSATIISATGLTDNTSSPQHYSFVRDGNDWEIYQNGVSEATATDSTSLGTNVGNNYSTNLDGMIDEYFVNSDVLTATEIDSVYERGVAPTLLTTTGASTTEHDDSTVVGGNTYYFTLKSTNAIGDSDFLTPFVSGLAGTPPGVPTGVSTAINNPNTTPLDITVSWSAPTNVGSGTLTGFEIYRDGVLVDTVGLVSSVPNTVPSGGGTFIFGVKAISNHGSSGLSTTSSITTPSIPDTPAAPTGSINDPNGSPLDVTVSWVAPNAGGSAITNYDLYRSSTSGSGFTIIQSGITGLTHTDTTPSAGTWYYTVAANNLVGSSLQSPELSVSTPSVPSAVSDLAGSTVSDTAINLTWSAPSNGGSNIIDYTIYRDGVSIDTVTTPGYSDTGLTQQTSYTYTVYTRNNVGTSLVSNSVSQETHGVPAVVPSFQATSAALDAITLSWTEPNDYNSAITSYVIERESPVGGGFAPLDTISPATTYSDTGLVSVQEYNYRIKAVNSYGNGPTATSSTITLPAPPTDVVVTPSTSTSELTVTWNTPTLTTGITGYQIVREDGVGTGFTPITIASGTSFTDTGLSTNIYYNYKMASVTVQGNSAYSNTYVQTTYHLPNGVESLTATSGELIDAGLSWSAPSVPYGYITGYEIYQSTTGTPNVLIDSITATSYTATNLDPTVTYYWLVAPVTIHGSNSTGNIANATATSEIIIGDIELSTDINPDTAPILFDQVRTGNSTALTVTYPNTYDLTCETEYKFGRNTQSYSNLVPVTVSSTQSSHTFNFNNSANEIISVRCYDENTNPGGVNPNDPNDGKDQINFSTQPIVTQVNDFQKGLYGISGGFGAFDLATLFVVIISMVGFNRRNPAVGVGIMVTFIGAMAYFGIIETPTIVMGAIALVTVLAIGVARNKL